MVDGGTWTGVGWDVRRDTGVQVAFRILGASQMNKSKPPRGLKVRLGIFSPSTGKFRNKSIWISDSASHVCPSCCRPTRGRQGPALQVTVPAYRHVARLSILRLKKAVSILKEKRRPLFIFHGQQKEEHRGVTPHVPLPVAQVETCLPATRNLVETDGRRDSTWV